MSSGKDILFFSDTIFDIDLGVFGYFYTHLFNSPYFDQEKLLKTPEMLKSYLVLDCLTNILDFALKPQFRGTSDSLFREALDKHYQEIVNFSPYTDILKIVLAQLDSQASINISPVVLCRSEFEIELLHKINNNIECILCPTDKDIMELSLKRFTRILLRRVTDIPKFSPKELGGKNIVILSYRYNFEVNNIIELRKEYVNTLLANEFESMIPYANLEELQNYEGE